MAQYLGHQIQNKFEYTDVLSNSINQNITKWSKMIIRLLVGPPTVLGVDQTSTIHPSIYNSEKYLKMKSGNISYDFTL